MGTGSGGIIRNWMGSEGWEGWGSAGIVQQVKRCARVIDSR